MNIRVPSPTRGEGEKERVRRDDSNSHRHLAMPHRRARGEPLRGVDDGVGVHAVVAVEVVDGAGLAEMLDACPLSGVLQTQTGHRLRSIKCQQRPRVVPQTGGVLAKLDSARYRQLQHQELGRRPAPTCSPSKVAFFLRKKMWPVRQLNGTSHHGVMRSSLRRRGRE
jgi:hypothetical protein